jgi:nitroimidazol reductase NimA-like FMN-containing flavoprotein (pyridoxamine 5'-phosphate oxidase superfamily)
LISNLRVKDGKGKRFFHGGPMSTKRFETRDRTVMEEVLKTAAVGYLSFNGPDGWPRVTPLNFVFDGRILWHGAIFGERFECLQKDPRATFLAVFPQIYLPSYFASAESACHANMAYSSTLVRGRVTALQDPEEKCAVLNQLMEKYQPEAQYRKIAPEDALYKKILPATGIYALSIEDMAGKFNISQNKPEEVRKNIADRLKQRGTAVDLLVADKILKTL